MGRKRSVTPKANTNKDEKATIDKDKSKKRKLEQSPKGNRRKNIEEDNKREKLNFRTD